MASFSKDIVREQVVTILASDQFKHARQLQNFLTYIVDCASQGKEYQLTAYNVATNALGRGSKFAPDQDPIVRVLASKLRRRLKLYNHGAGADDLIHITLPKGGYIPLIEENILRNKNMDLLEPDTTHRTNNPATDTEFIPIILIKNFSADENEFCEEFAEDIFNELISAFTKFDLVKTVPLRKNRPTPEPAISNLKSSSAVYRLNG